jgi:hypothetical protein
VYVLEPVEDGGDAEALHFMLSQNDSMRSTSRSSPAVDGSSIVGRRCWTQAPINIADLARPTRANRWRVRHNRSFDDKTGYRARSMLTVPMLSAQNEVIGVIQLINKKRAACPAAAGGGDFEAEVIPFDVRSEELALALASAGGVCLENAMLYKEITNLFEGFVDASVTAIEARDPPPRALPARWATLTVALAQKVDAVSDGPLRDVRLLRPGPAPDRVRGRAARLRQGGRARERAGQGQEALRLAAAAIELRFRYIRKALEAECLKRASWTWSAGAGARGGGRGAGGRRRRAGPRRWPGSTRPGGW